MRIRYGAQSLAPLGTAGLFVLAGAGQSAASPGELEEVKAQVRQLMEENRELSRRFAGMEGSMAKEAAWPPETGPGDGQTPNNGASRIAP